MNCHKVLLIIGQDMRSLYHHRGEHLSYYLSERFDHLDVVSITKMYEGAGTDPLWKKALLGVRDLVQRPVIVARNGKKTDFIVRFPRLPGILDYAFRDYWMYLCLRRKLRRSYDLCILSHPRLAFIGSHLKKVGGAKVLIYDDWDYFPGLYPHDRSWQRSMRTREGVCVRNADAVVCVNGRLEQLRREQGAVRTTVIPNGVDYALFQQAQTKESHPPTLVYMGTLSEAWGADLPISAMPAILERFPNAQYAILGRGPDEERLRKLTRQLGLDSSVRFHGNLPYKDLPGYLARADIGVATSRNTDFRNYASPLKLIEYMAAGLPVVATNFGETADIIKRSMAGVAIDFSSQEFARAVIKLFSDSEEYEIRSGNAKSYALDHDWMHLFHREMKFIQQIVEHKGREGEIDAR